jgi:hypothetical protein
MLGLTCVLSLVATALLLWDDRTSLASFQHYSRSGWHFVLFIGLYGTAVLYLMAWIGRMALQLLALPVRMILGRSGKRALGAAALRHEETAPCERSGA